MYWYNFWLRRWQWYFIIFTCGSCLDSILFMVIKEWIKWIAIVNLWMFCSSKIFLWVLVIIFYDWTTYLFAIFHPFSRNRCSFVVIVFTIYTNATFQSGFFLLQYKFSVIWIQNFLAWIKYSMILFLFPLALVINRLAHSTYHKVHTFPIIELIRYSPFSTEISSSILDVWRRIFLYRWDLLPFTRYG